LRRTKVSRPKVRSKGSLEIRCRLNALTFKSLKYALSYALKYAVKPRSSNTSLYAQKLVSSMRDTDSILNSLKYLNEPDVNAHVASIEATLKTYVGLFYSMSSEERKRYINSFNSGTITRIKPERNLLVIPALEAELKLLKSDEVSIGLFRLLYRIPLKVLHDSSKSALQVAKLQRNMAIKTVSYENVKRLSESIEKLEERLGAIEGGDIQPPDDEDVKDEFINNAAEFSKGLNINILEIIGERVGTESAIRTRMLRMMRKQRY
jgi:hypothetical protein